MKTVDLKGTIWICTDTEMPEYNMKCIVISGDTNPEWNGDNDIKIRYQDDSITYMKLRRFMLRFEKVK